MNWPWAQRARLKLRSRDGDVGEFTISFDPAALLPPPLNKKKIEVIDDSGSSVLLGISEKKTRPKKESSP